jgi:hypothetical protein
MTARLAMLTCGVACVLLAGCAAREPVLMTAQYPPTSEAAPAETTRAEKTAVCTVRLAAVRDQRTDPRSLGDTGLQPVLTDNSAEWIGSGIRSLDSPSLKFIDQPEPGGAELVIDIDLLKAYAMNVNTNRIVSVVIRVKYSRHGTPIDEQVYRGSETGVNWSAGADETRDALNSALGKLREPVRQDILSRCAAG